MGTITYPDGATYTGQFAAGQTVGHRRLVMADAVTYDVEWAEGQINGTGVLTQPQRRCLRRHAGQRQRQGHRRGALRQRRPLRGRVRRRSLHGTGTFTATDGYTYVGDWVEGRIAGQGRVYLSRRVGLRRPVQSNDLAHGTGTDQPISPMVRPYDRRT